MIGCLKYSNLFYGSARYHDCQTRSWTDAAVHSECNEKSFQPNFAVCQLKSHGYLIWWLRFQMRIAWLFGKNCLRGHKVGSPGRKGCQWNALVDLFAWTRKYRTKNILVLQKIINYLIFVLLSEEKRNIDGSVWNISWCKEYCWYGPHFNLQWRKASFKKLKKKSSGPQLPFKKLFISFKDCRQFGMATTAIESKEQTARFFHRFWNLKRGSGLSHQTSACRCKRSTCESRLMLVCRLLIIQSISATLKYVCQAVSNNCSQYFL